jgi:hypothetical protein
MTRSATRNPDVTAPGARAGLTTGNTGPVPDLSGSAPLPPAAPHGYGTGDIMRSAQEAAREWAQAAVRSLRGGCGTASRQSRLLASRVGDAAGECCESAGGFVRRHPLASLAAAGLAGFLVAGAACGVRRRRAWR